MSDNNQTTNHIICVGAVYVDTILTVPHFPIEDEKLRAKKLARRRGGNTANTLEVLTQLLEHDPTTTPSSSNGISTSTTELHLLSVLPDKASNAAGFVRDSLPGVDVDEGSIFRGGHSDAASSYIIQSQQSLSRTIVSINELPEMTVDEFIASVNNLVSKQQSQHQAWKKVWFHFEGRIPDITLQCVTYLRRQFPEFKISVECEKPERTQMREVAQHADVVFYSKLWAEKNGFATARAFLEAQRGETRDGALLCCTWGSGGAVVVQKKGGGDGEGGEEEVWADVEAWKGDDGGGGRGGGRGEGDGKGVVDTIGAGDTFIAGMLFGIVRHGRDWSLGQKLEFANQVAGRKVLQEGFGGLGRQMR
ncbi:hypothetical protein N0V83_002533 [Neocucurbitaria cava]|uniref:Carbohydrate kinase PfkB domain-containing protein n=1 Tax=Neocucurbitaria cava TaxID=798079 RepID=A0A9W8YCD7_9PLEO|nr:hypothetical protein N0V83_002533 [Neocucurbitaria cava]